MGGPESNHRAGVDAEFGAQSVLERIWPGATQQRRSAYPCLSLARRSAAGALVSELDEYLC
jgi:hypothetical protein